MTSLDQEIAGWNPVDVRDMRALLNGIRRKILPDDPVKSAMSLNEKIEARIREIYKGNPT